MSSSVVKKIQNDTVSLPLPKTTESRRILIVEDEEEILNAYKDILNKPSKVTPIKSSRSSRSAAPVAAPEIAGGEAYEVTAVNNGEKALEAVKQAKQEGRPFALGFFDVLLGEGIDGIEAVRRIHEMDRDMYAVLVTAYQDRHVDSIHAIFGKEFQDRWDYLNKPFSEGEIIQKARGMVSMWNVRRRELEQREWLDEMRHRLAESEKMLTVAAVARSVGHEFGNILLQIMGRADLSRNGDAEAMKKALDTILLATEHAAKVLERFKSLAKPVQTHEKKPMDIATPIREAMALIQHELERRRIEPIVNVEENLVIKGNHSTLVQVFMNLVINAMHAMNEDGRIEIKGRKFEGEAELTVRDTGTGIPEKHLETVFEPFFTTKGEKGTGLGLAICKEIVEITHGGKLSVANHPEGGAEFKMTFPLVQEDES